MFICDTSERKVIKRKRQQIGENKCKFVEYEEDNAYYVGLLNERDKEFIKGIKFIKETAVDSFFDNLDEECEEIIKTDDEAEKVKEALFEWIDSEIDEVVVSMIDSMDDEEYRYNYIKEFGKESYERNIGE